MSAYKTLAWIAVLATLAAAAVPASADTYFEGTPYKNWQDQTSFAVNDLTGYVNWIVYAPGDFPYSGYTPTASEFAYVYQVFSTGADQIHGFSVNLENQADNIGAFGQGVVPDGGTSLDPSDSAFWEFGLQQGYSPVGQGQNSQMLAFSSEKAPEELFGGVLDGGNSTRIEVLPSPGSIGISIGVPEPSTVSLMAVGLGTWAIAWAVRRRQGRNGL